MKIHDFELPNDYFNFIKSCQEFDFYLNSGACLYLYNLSELEFENSETIVPLSNFFAIGNNGGDVGVFYSKKDKKLYSIPYTGMEDGDEILLADNFISFIEKFNKNELKKY